jgi:hypothetical protein
MAAEFQMISMADQIRLHIQDKILERLKDQPPEKVFEHLVLFLDSKKISFPLRYDIVIGPDSSERSDKDSYLYKCMREIFITMVNDWKMGKIFLSDIAILSEKALSKKKISFPLSDVDMFEPLREPFYELFQRTDGRDCDTITGEEFFNMFVKLVGKRLSDLKGE